MKNPVAGGKASLPGPLAVKLVDGVATVFPQKSGLVSADEDLLQTIYDCGPVHVTLPNCAPSKRPSSLVHNMNDFNMAQLKQC